MSSFPIRVADALVNGASRKHLRNSSWDQSVWGVRRDASAEASFEDRCRMLALRMPVHAFFSHSTAALLMRAPLPWALELDSLLHVGVVRPTRAPHAKGLIGHSIQLSGSVWTTDGIRHSSPAQTWCELAGQLSLLDLIAVGDYLIHHRRRLASRAQLERAVAALGMGRHVRKLREALLWLSDRAESRPESHLRVIVVRAGLPVPEVNYVIVDTETGKHARTDLAFPLNKLIIEYQGDYHRTAVQWRKDMTRRTRLESAGWYVMELNSDDLKDPDELVDRIRKALARR